MAIENTVSCIFLANRRSIVVCLVSWFLNESEAGVALVLIATYLLFLC